jgi:hypothetical protein
MQHTWPFPAFADPLRAYIALSDFVGLLWLRDRSPIQVCGFCRTAGSRKARCEVCGTVHMPEKTSSTASPSTADEGQGALPLAPIVHVMARLLIVPLLLFIAFCVGYALHHRSQSYSSQEAQSAEQVSIAQAPVEVEARSPQLFVSPLVAPPVASSVTSGDDPANRPRAVTVSRALASAASRRSTSYKPSGSARSAVLCAGRNVLMHAVCMNNLCASPDQARRPQCAAAVAQRRLDEARRNPVLAN